LALSEPERIFDIAIVSKIPVTFARVMFAPAILASVQELTDDFKDETGQLRIVASDASDHGRALAPVPARDLAVLARHPGLTDRDRP